MHEGGEATYIVLLNFWKERVNNVRVWLHNFTYYGLNIETNLKKEGFILSCIN